MPMFSLPRSARGRFILLVLSITSFGGWPAFAASMWVQPTFHQQQTRAVFAPLIHFLNVRAGLQIELGTHPTFQHHWIALRSGATPDYLVEDVHIADYAIQNLGYRPVVRAAEMTRYSLVVLDTSSIEDLNDLIGLKVATLSAPSISYIMMLHWFDDPISAPELDSSTRSWLDGIEMIFSGEVSAAVIPSGLAERYPNLRVISESRELPAATILVSDRVSSEQADLLKQALLEIGDHPDFYEVLHELDITQFVESDAVDYLGYQETLTRMYSFTRINSPLLERTQLGSIE